MLILFQFFSLEAYGRDNKPLSIDQIYKELQSVMDMSKKPDVSVGILTTENRNTWAKSYNHLIKGIKIYIRLR